jgi:hypothetical protein
LVRQLVFTLKSHGATHQMIGFTDRMQGGSIAREAKISRNPLLNGGFLIVNAVKTTHRIGASTIPTLAGASCTQG